MSESSGVYNGSWMSVGEVGKFGSGRLRGLYPLVPPRSGKEDPPQRDGTLVGSTREERTGRDRVGQELTQLVRHLAV